MEDVIAGDVISEGTIVLIKLLLGMLSPLPNPLAR